MIKIELAECSGFCFGVKRAISMAKQALERNKGKNVYSLGHIIHNSQVVEELSKEGLRSIRELGAIKDGVIVISSHGVSPEIFDEIKLRGLEIIDATCPYVVSAQKIVKALNEEGYTVIIFGDSQHPEVKSLVGFAGDRATVIKAKEDVERLQTQSQRIGLVSQTTQSAENYLEVISAIMKKEFLEVRIFNTICSDTKKRQESAQRLARIPDGMIVIGGRMSANTKRLFEICSKICDNTCHIETADELGQEWFSAKKSVGIASGASTPDWIIKAVEDKIKNKILYTRG